MCQFSLVGRLLFTCGPFAVLGRVWSVIIDSFESHAIWSRTHVVIEVLKTLHPSSADENTSCSVMLIVWAFGVQAALFHGGPDVPIFRSALAVRGVQVARSLSPKAPTARGACAQRGEAQGFNITAIASKFPYGTVTSTLSCWSNRHESPVSLAGHIFGSCHILSYSI